MNPVDEFLSSCSETVHGSAYDSEKPVAGQEMRGRAVNTVIKRAMMLGVGSVMLSLAACGSPLENAADDYRQQAASQVETELAAQRAQLGHDVMKITNEGGKACYALVKVQSRAMNASIGAPTWRQYGIQAIDCNDMMDKKELLKEKSQHKSGSTYNNAVERARVESTFELYDFDRSHSSDPEAIKKMASEQNSKAKALFDDDVRKWIKNKRCMETSLESNNCNWATGVRG